MNIIETQNLSKFFTQPFKIPVLKNISFNLNKGEFASIIGKSGCGKSTLLYVLSTLDRDYSGNLIIDGELMRHKNESQLAAIRLKKIGFVFQFHYLLNEFSVLKNIMLPALRLNEFPEKKIKSNALEILDQLNMLDLAHKKAFQISGGQKQRVAIARAMINKPLIIMADEPTGNLDKSNTVIVCNTFKDLAQNFQQTFLIVTHDLEFASHTHRTIVMEDGEIIK